MALRSAFDPAAPASGKAWRASALLSLVLAVAAVAIAAVAKFRSPAQVAERFTGAAGYWEIAEDFARRGMPLDAGRPPGYPLFLALPAGLLPGDGALAAAAALQTAMAVGIVMLTWLLARRLAAAPGLALAAAALVAGNLALHLEFLALRETGLYALMLLLTMLAAIARGPGFAAAAGLCAAGAWLTRPTGLGPAGIVGLWYAGRWLRHRDRTSGLDILSYTAALMAPLAFWLACQVATAQEPLRISGNRGAAPLYYGVHPAARLAYPMLDIDELDAVILPEVAAAAGGKLPPDPEPVLRELRRLRLAEDPAAPLRLLPEKLAAFFLPLPFPFADGSVRALPDGGFEVRVERVLTPVQMLLGAAALPGVAAFLVALVRLRRLEPVGLVIVGIVAATAAIHLLTFAETRYRQPLDPLLAVLAVMMVAMGKEKPGPHDGGPGAKCGKG